MSMHMIRGVQVHGKCKKKLTPKDRKAAIEHEKWLKSMGVGKTKAENTNTIPDYSTIDTVKLSNKIAGHGAAKERNVYSGERQLLGIATMHKSNMVPIFADKKQDAKDIAEMRRN